MKIIKYPTKDKWNDMLRRPAADSAKVEADVRNIIAAVRKDDDRALRDLTKKFDGADLTDLEVSEAEITKALKNVPTELKAAIEVARANIEKFHNACRERSNVVETMPGVYCWRKSVAIEKVGLYIPAGSAPLFSTVLMLGIPAKTAGCRDIVLCTPPDSDGKIDETLLYTAASCGVRTIFKVGGAQAIAAMAYGTDSIPNVYKIFGPGNSFVTCAKQIVSMDVAIDMPAGPSEVAVLADSSCNPAFVAADLLSQAEHGPDSQVMLVATDELIIEQTLSEIETKLSDLPRTETAKESLANSTAILVNDLGEGLDLLDQYAPEHLIIAAENADELAEKVINAGSVFIGNYSCESAGDYASGTNHTLPTGGWAKSSSGVSVDSFVKKITFQKLTAEGVRNIGPSVEIMAAAEHLEAHKRAISVRLEVLNGI